jgi:hypothetical protein
MLNTRWNYLKGYTDIQEIYIFKGDVFILFLSVLYSTLLHLPSLGLHCVVGCWDRTQDAMQLQHWLSDALTTLG